MKNKELEIELTKWFNNTNHNYKNFWTHNPIAKIIKSKLNRWGNWRKKPKGYIDF